MKALVYIMVTSIVSVLGGQVATATNLDCQTVSTVSKCNGQILSRHDNQTGKDYTQIGVDTFIKCHNYSTGENLVYSYCAKDGEGGRNDPGNSWSCQEL